MSSSKKHSHIGFGAYRISVKSQKHHQALQHALHSGCNLIDTSSNYTDGDSEKLIGQVLKQSPEYKAFVITKAGYIQGHNFVELEKLHQQNKGKEDLVVVSQDLLHSIHPDFLLSQIESSQKRLQKDCLDCFLLHNPEYYFKGAGTEPTQKEYYRRIEKALFCLEEAVQNKKISSYGISSNSFIYPTDHFECTDFNRILNILEKIKKKFGKQHFEYIQFPFNLVETGAIEKHYQGHTLLDVARQNQITTLANRPLNAFGKEGLIRLATYERSDQILKQEDARDIFTIVINQLKKKWKENEDPQDFEQVPLLQQFRQIWDQLPTPDAVDQVFLGHFFPFAAKIWGSGGIPKEEAKPFHLLYETATQLSKKRMTAHANRFRQDLIQQGLIQINDQRPLSQIACQFYLDSGVDHVLVGMRKTQYVDDLKDLF